MTETASSFLGQYLQFGLAAAMPVTPNVLGCIAFYYATDTNVLSVWDNAAWVTVPTGASTSALTLITEVVTASSASSVTFSAIPGTYRDLIIKVRGQGDSGAAADIHAQFNADTAGNYDVQYVATNNTTTTGTPVDATTAAILGSLSATGSLASVPGACEATIFDYKGTTFNKCALGQFGYKTATSSSGSVVGSTESQWRNSAAITAVKVFLSAGNFVNGSVVSLYGSL